MKKGGVESPARRCLTVTWGLENRLYCAILLDLLSSFFTLNPLLVSEQT